MCFVVIILCVALFIPGVLLCQCEAGLISKITQRLAFHRRFERGAPGARVKIGRPPLSTEYLCRRLQNKRFCKLFRLFFEKKQIAYIIEIDKVYSNNHNPLKGTQPLNHDANLNHHHHPCHPHHNAHHHENVCLV